MRNNTYTIKIRPTTAEKLRTLKEVYEIDTYDNAIQYLFNIMRTGGRLE